MTRVWSPQQEAIFHWAREGTGNLVVRARAGCGKTTSILEAIIHAPEQNILLCAFNKRIADELSTRLRNPHAEAKTLHSVGFALVRKQWKVRVDEDRGKRLAALAWSQERGGSPEDAPDAPIAWVARLAGVAKSTGHREIDVSALTDLAYTYNIVPEGAWERDLTVEDLADLAVCACSLAYEKDGSIDYDDMIWLPVMHNWPRPVYDLVVVDEAQDMNGAQLTLALGVAAGRIVVVGDDRQAIYSFRGADSNALNRLKQVLNASELPLNVTYRCPKKVVIEARALCPDFEAHETAPEGTVLTMTEEEMVEKVEANDFLLSRLNAPLAGLWLKLVRGGKPARVEGRDLAKGLITLIRTGRSESVADLIVSLHQRLDREVLKLQKTKRRSAEGRVDFLRDQMEMIEALSEGLVTTGELTSRVEQMFGIAGVPRACVVLSTIHRAKGLEANRVFLMVDTLYCWGKRRQSIEEANIHYVGITRAKEMLVLVRTVTPPLKPEEEKKDGQGAAGSAESQTGDSVAGQGSGESAIQPSTPVESVGHGPGDRHADDQAGGGPPDPSRVPASE